MSIFSAVGARKWMALWGWLDIASVAFYVARSIYLGRVPIYTDVFSAYETHDLYGSSLPIIVSLASAALCVSLVVSGYLLIQRKNAGRYLAFIQALPRLILFMPSLFFLAYMGKLFGASWALMVVVVLSELVKLYTIRRRSHGPTQAELSLRTPVS